MDMAATLRSPGHHGTVIAIKDDAGEQGSAQGFMCRTQRFLRHKYQDQSGDREMAATLNNRLPGPK